MNTDFNNNIPIYIQVLDYIKTYIISGKIGTGEKLPSVRELANLFKVNPNTIQKALIELENDELIYTERTNGKFVTMNQKVIDKIKKEYAMKIVYDFFNNMNRIGLDKTSAIDYLNGKD